MAIESLADYDFTAGREPDPHLEPRLLLESWLAYQRHEFFRKLRDLDPAQLAAWSISPVELSVLGLVRADKVIASLPTSASEGLGHGRPLQATLVKMIHEYTLHAGQTHMLRFAALGGIVR